MNYARPTALNKEPVNLGEIVDMSLKLIGSDAQALGVETTLQVEPGLPSVTVDKDKINQVLLNLYLNALQAMEYSPAPKELQVSVHHDPQAEMVIIEVRDTGSGIASEDLDKVLDPYFTTKSDGTGLGLALAYKIIDEHRGTIRFASSEGKGTTVMVSLPIH